MRAGVGDAIFQATAEKVELAPHLDQRPAATAFRKLCDALPYVSGWLPSPDVVADGLLAAVKQIADISAGEVNVFSVNRNARMRLGTFERDVGERSPLVGVGIEHVGAGNDVEIGI